MIPVDRYNNTGIYLSGGIGTARAPDSRRRPPKDQFSQGGTREIQLEGRIRRGDGEEEKAEKEREKTAGKSGSQVNGLGLWLKKFLRTFFKPYFRLLDWRPDKLPGTRPKNEKIVVIRNMFDSKEFDVRFKNEKMKFFLFFPCSIISSIFSQ